MFILVAYYCSGLLSTATLTLIDSFSFRVTRYRDHPRRLYMYTSAARFLRCAFCSFNTTGSTPCRPNISSSVRCTTTRGFTATAVRFASRCPFASVPVTDSDQWHIYGGGAMVRLHPFDLTVNLLDDFYTVSLSCLLRLKRKIVSQSF